MLSACARSADKPGPVLALAPVVETRVERVTVCPVEVVVPLPDRAAMPADATINAAPSVLQWIAARFAREELIEKRLIGARSQCPNG